MLTDTPWKFRDMQNVLVRTALGLVLIVGGWLGASSTATWREQLIWMAIGLLGSVIAAVAGVGWLLNGLATLGRERAEVRHMVADRVGAYDRLPDARVDSNVATVGAADATTEFGGVLVSALGMTHFHLSSCQAVAYKDVDELSFAECMDRNLSPCGMCRP